MEINQYPNEAFVINDEDFYDVDYWTGTAFESRKISGLTLKTILSAAAETIYNSDGVISGPRQVNMNGQIITFDGGASDSVVEFLSPNTGGMNFRNGTGQKRWAIVKDVDGTGSNFKLQRFDATGSLIEDSIFIDSTAGAIQFNNAYTFPTTDGATDQVLMTDGAGNVNWISIADRNIYDIDGVLDSNRILSMDGKNLRFENDNVATGNFQIQIGEYLSAPVLNSLLFQDQSSFSVEITDGNTSENSTLIQSTNSFEINVTDGATPRSALLNTSGFTINSAYTLPNTDGNAGQVMTTNGAGVASWSAQPEVIQLAASDETTALTTGTAKITFRMPYGMTLTGVRASLSTAQTGGAIFTVDINENGVSILSTKLTIDNAEKTSTTAATAAVISDSALADDAEITIDIDQVGDGTAKGLKITLIGTRS